MSSPPLLGIYHQTPIIYRYIYSIQHLKVFIARETLVHDNLQPFGILVSEKQICWIYP